MPIALPAQESNQHQPQGQDAQVGNVFPKQVLGPEGGQQGQEQKLRFH